MKKSFTVYVYPSYIAYEVEAENKEQAEDIAMKQYSYDESDIYKVESKLSEEE